MEALLTAQSVSLRSIEFKHSAYNLVQAESGSSVSMLKQDDHKADLGFNVGWISFPTFL